jgi:hypothetical protein
MRMYMTGHGQCASKQERLMYLVPLLPWLLFLPGEHLNVIYVSMLLSGGMPICYLTAAFWFGTAYW